MSRRHLPHPPRAIGWLRPLAESYLGPFALFARQSGGLSGYFFERQRGRSAVGFFVGFLSGDSRLYRQLHPQAPECVVAAFVRPARSRFHREVVSQPGSMFRQSYELLLKYTPTRPRFEFYEEAAVAIVRHVPLANFPRRLQSRYARNFFIESLALIVRTRLPEYLRGVKLGAAREAPTRQHHHSLSRL